LNYDGWWKDNEFHSCAKNKNDKTDLRYKQNKLTLGTGDTYEGGFSHGRMHDVGRFESTTGAWYEGKYRNGAKHGFGREGVKIKDEKTGEEVIKEKSVSYTEN